MPSRIVREGINSSPRINALSPLAELFYRRLMSVADDYGRFHAAPGTLRGACWPTCPEKVREGQIMEWLKECSDGPNPLIMFYEVAGCTYLEICDFGQQKRGKSKFPERLSVANHPLITCESSVHASRSRISYFDSRIAEAEAEPDAPPPTQPPAKIIDFKSDPSTDFDEMYRKHPIPGHKREARMNYQQIIASSVDPETRNTAIVRSHAEWLEFWAGPGLAEWKPNFVQFFEDEWYLRKPREPTTKQRKLPASTQPRNKALDSDENWITGAELIRQLEEKGL